jgi:hypothetical protein
MKGLRPGSYLDRGGYLYRFLWFICEKNATFVVENAT